jgi:hypothetical protein
MFKSVLLVNKAPNLDPFVYPIVEPSVRVIYKIEFVPASILKGTNASCGKRDGISTPLLGTEI